MPNLRLVAGIAGITVLFSACATGAQNTATTEAISETSSPAGASVTSTTVESESPGTTNPGSVPGEVTPGTPASGLYRLEVGQCYDYVWEGEDASYLVGPVQCDEPHYIDIFGTVAVSDSADGSAFGGALASNQMHNECRGMVGSLDGASIGTLPAEAFLFLSQANSPPEELVAGEHRFCFLLRVEPGAGLIE